MADPTAGAEGAIDRPAGPAPDSTEGMGALARLKRLTLKELREILRDRRTIVTLVLMPLLLYPLLYLAFRQFMLTGVAEADPILLMIGFETEADGDWLNGFMALPILDSQRGPRGQPAQPPRTADGAAEPAPPRMRMVRVLDMDQQVKAGGIDLGIRLRGRRTGDDAGQVGPLIAMECELIYLEGSASGRMALEEIQKQLTLANEHFIARRLVALGSRQPSVAVRPRTSELARDGGHSRLSLATLVPVILILMTITGAVYPSIDLTAGERERGTLEMLIAAPVPRMGLLFAKYVTVLTVATLTAVVNLGMMTVTVYAGGLGGQLFGRGLSPLVMIEVLGLLLLFAAFFSAVLLTITSFARSFKEAQAYLIPIMLMSLAPAMLSMMPGIRLEGLLTVAPLINMVLLGRDLLEQNVLPGTAAVVVVSTLLYAATALAAAARVFGAEAVLYSETATWRELFQRPRTPRSAPTIAAAFLCLALLFPAHFLVSGMLNWLSPVATATDTSEPIQVTGGAAIEVRLALIAVVAVLLFVGAPLLGAWLGNVRLSTAFRLRFGPAAAFGVVAAILLGVSLWPFAHEIVVFQNQLGLFSLDAKKLERAAAVVRELKDVGVVFNVFVLAIVPAVCEELLFRGYLFSALAARRNAAFTILASGLLFGLFHLVVTDALAIERLIPSTLLGLVLGWIAWKTKSVIPGIVLHACHNGLLVSLLTYKDELAARGIGVEERSHLPLLWLAAAAAVAAIGATIVYLLPRNRPLADSRDAGG